ncbi:hypothetical protein [Pannonibacter phragmitetus]|uniref:hypothetical protein n=1 Tax=Pannonibacter phragmitetus TaxID=121719 RepID=UPI003D2EC6A2
MMGVAPIDGIVDPFFMFSWFKFLDLTSISSGSSVPQLNKQDLAPLVVNLPPFDLQREYGACIERISVSALDGANSQRAADSLFASLQHRAFTGQL